MKTVMIEKPHNIKLEKIEKPVLLDNEVMVKPMRGGICGTDVHIFEGNFIGTYPVIPCHEFSGEVVETGKDVKDVKVGDKVIIDPNIRCHQCEPCRTGKLNICESFSAVGVTRTGGFSEFVNVPEANVYKFENCSYETAAFGEPLACVLYGQGRIKFAAGKRVIIWGAGAIGLLHVMACKNIHGCDDITVVDLDEEKLELAKKAGAKNTVIADGKMNENLQKINNGKFDIAIEATGNVKALHSLFDYLGRGGQALLFGVYDQNAELKLKPFDIFINDWSIVGSLTYNHDFHSAVKALDNGLITPEFLIGQSVTLNEAPEIIERMGNGARLGKVQVRIQ